MVDITITIPNDKASRLKDMLENFGDYKKEWDVHLSSFPEATNLELVKAVLIGVLKKDVNRYETKVAKNAVSINIDDKLIE